jgi:hypothetical protein
MQLKYGEGEKPGFMARVRMARQITARKRGLLLAAGVGGLALAVLASGWPAQAQFFPFDDRFFGPPRQQKPRAPVQQEQTTAPAPKKAEVPPTIRILVLGDSRRLPKSASCASIAPIPA